MLDIAVQLILNEEYQLAIELLEQSKDNSGLDGYILCLLYRLLGQESQELEFSSTLLQKNNKFKTYYESRLDFHHRTPLAKYCPRQPQYWERRKEHIPYQSTIDGLCFILAGDSNYFDMLFECVSSIKASRYYKNTPICVLDCGLSNQNIAVLKKLGVFTFRQPDYDLHITLFNNQPFDRNKQKSLVLGLLVRPFLPKYFPNYRYYFWIDCDTWVQDDRALDWFVKLAEQQGFAVSQNPCHRTKNHHFFDKPLVSSKIKDYLSDKTMIFGGAFCCDKESGFFDEWQKIHRQTVSEYGLWHITDEFTASYIFHKKGMNNFVPDSQHFSFFHAGCPVVRGENPTLLDLKTQEPIGIVHLAGAPFKKFRSIQTLDLQEIDKLSAHVQKSIMNYHIKYPNYYYNDLDDSWEENFNSFSVHKNVEFRYFVYPDTEKELAKNLLSKELLKEKKLSYQELIVMMLKREGYQLIIKLLESKDCNNAFDVRLLSSLYVINSRREDAKKLLKHKGFPINLEDKRFGRKSKKSHEGDTCIVTFATDVNFVMLEGLLRSINATSIGQNLPIVIFDGGLSSIQKDLLKHDYEIIDLYQEAKKFQDFCINVDKRMGINQSCLLYHLRPRLAEFISFRYAIWLDPFCWVQNENALITLVQGIQNNEILCCEQLPFDKYDYFNFACENTKQSLKEKKIFSVNCFSIDLQSPFAQNWRQMFLDSNVLQTIWYGLDQVTLSVLAHQKNSRVKILPQETVFNCDVYGFPSICSINQSFTSPFTGEQLGILCVENYQELEPHYQCLAKTDDGAISLEYNKKIAKKFIDTPNNMLIDLKKILKDTGGYTVKDIRYMYPTENEVKTAKDYVNKLLI